MGEPQGFMPDDRFPRSRDHALDEVTCRRTKCAANVMGRCVMPSCIEINEDGQCGGFHGKTESPKEEGTNGA